MDRRLRSLPAPEDPEPGVNHLRDRPPPQHSACLRDHNTMRIMLQVILGMFQFLLLTRLPMSQAKVGGPRVGVMLPHMTSSQLKEGVWGGGVGGGGDTTHTGAIFLLTPGGVKG